jgi:hypothetical protein
MKDKIDDIDEEELLEILAEQKDPVLQRDLEESEREIDRGEVGTEEELFEILGGK